MVEMNIDKLIEWMSDEDIIALKEKLREREVKAKPIKPKKIRKWNLTKKEKDQLTTKLKKIKTICRKTYKREILLKCDIRYHFNSKNKVCPHLEYVLHRLDSTIKEQLEKEHGIIKLVSEYINEVNMCAKKYKVTRAEIIKKVDKSKSPWFRK